jgi:hypothetical protein
MSACSYCWSYYMDAMMLARQTADPSRRKALIREAYMWLQRYFEAEDNEVARMSV